MRFYVFYVAPKMKEAQKKKNCALLFLSLERATLYLQLEFFCAFKRAAKAKTPHEDFR